MRIERQLKMNAENFIFQLKIIQTMFQFTLSQKKSSYDVLQENALTKNSHFKA